MKQKYISLLAIVAAAFLFGPSSALAQPFPPEPTVILNNAQSFAVLAGSTVTNTGATVVNGDLGVSPGLAITGAPVVTGATYTGALSFAGLAQGSLSAAMIDAAGRTCDRNLTGTDLGTLGVPLTPGVYCFAAEALLTGTLNLDFQGNPNAVFIFQIGTKLDTAVGSSINLINAGTTCPPNVFFQVGSSAVLFTGTTFVGNILADQTITLQTGSTLRGRALASIGAVNLAANTVTACGAAGVPPGVPPGVPAIPTLDFYGLAFLVVLLAGAGVFLMNRFAI